MLKTYGLDIAKIIEEARSNGNVEFAELVEKQVANLQACYDVVAQKFTSTNGENPWNVDVEYLKTLLK